MHLNTATRIKIALPCLLACLLAALTTTLGAKAEPARGAMQYLNPKYGFSLVLPGNVFMAGVAQNPDDGAHWISTDKQARLIAVAAPNSSNLRLSEYRAFVMQQTYAGATFDYTPVRDNWFVLSGRMEGQIFYERITFACDGRYIYGWQMIYPIAERRRYDRIVEAVHRSYRPGRGEDGRCGRAAREPG